MIEKSLNIIARKNQGVSPSSATFIFLSSASFTHATVAIAENSKAGRREETEFNSTNI
jgi:hypothetical protein